MLRLRLISHQCRLVSSKVLLSCNVITLRRVSSRPYEANIRFIFKLLMVPPANDSISHMVKYEADLIDLCNALYESARSPARTQSRSLISRQADACTLQCSIVCRVYRDLEKQGLPPSKSFPATTDASPTSDSSRQQEPLPLEQEQADEIELIFNAYAVSLETSLKGTVMDPESKMHLSLPASACTQSQQSSGADGMCAVPPPAPGAPDSSSQGTAAASRTANGVAASSASPDATPTQAAGLGSGVGAGADANGSGPSTPASSASGGSGSTGSLLAAMMRASLPPNLSGGSLDSMIRTVTDMINLCEISMRRIIAFAKRLPAFKRLPQPEQMILLKGGSVELLILRGVIAYDLEHDVFHGALAYLTDTRC